MRKFNWQDFVGGWFVGNFDPSILSTSQFEVCIKRYKAGDKDARHIHLIAEEITMIVEGSVKMEDQIYEKNDIIVIEKGEPTDFEALTDAITCVVKVPCAIGDKHEV